MRIGDVAKLVGTTPRTIRYCEKMGVLAPAPERPAGQHRIYTDTDVERLREVLRLRDLLGVSQVELKELVANEDERVVLRSEYRRTDSPAKQQRILRRLHALAARQLALIDRRAAELQRLRGEIDARRARIEELLEDEATVGTGA